MITTGQRFAILAAALATLTVSCASPRSQLSVSGKQAPPSLAPHSPQVTKSLRSTMDAAASVAGLPILIIRMAVFAAQGGCC